MGARSVWRVATVWFCLAIAPAVATAQGGQPAPSGAAQPPCHAALQQAQRCHAAGDLGCVLRLLEPLSPPREPCPAAVEPERLRLVAYAAARLDRHDLAQRSFAAWVRLSPQHRLDRAATPPAVYADYAAALLEVAGPALDTTPRLDAHPQLAVPPPAAASWPRFDPPPRSLRDEARDFVFLLGPNATLQAAGATGALGGHLGVQLGVELEPVQRWRLGANFHLLRWRDGSPATTRTGAMLRGAWALWPRGLHRLELVAAAGMALSADAAVATSAALAAGLRYHAHASDRALGWYLEAMDHWRPAGEHLLSLSVGIALRPARAATLPPAASTAVATPAVAP